MIEYVLNLIAQSSVAALLLFIVGYFCRKMILIRLTKSVEHEFDKKLATFKQKLEEETNRLDSVRSAGFAALLAQRNALSTKRVEAAQGLWNGVLEVRKGITVAMTVEILKIEEIVKSLDDPKTQTLMKTIAPAELVSHEYVAKLASYAVHQPFVSPVAWALYIAYSTIIIFPIAKLQALQLGFDPSRFLREVHWVELLGQVLPPEDFNKLGKSPQYNLQWAIKKLEERIVDELRRSLAGESAGLEGVTEAQRILEVAEKLQQKNPIKEA